MKINLMTAILCAGLILCSPISGNFGYLPGLSACAHEEHAKSVVETDYHDLALMSIAEEYSKCGEYDQALKTAALFHDPLLKSNALFLVGKIYFDNNQKVKAFSLFDEAVKIIESLKKPEILQSALLDVAEKYIDASDKDKALQNLKRASEQTEKVSDPRAKAEGFANIASKLNRIDQRELAKTTALSIDGFLIKYSTLLDISESGIKAGDDANGQKLLAAIIEEIKKHENPTVRFKLHSRASDLYLNTVNKDKAEEMLSVALKDADQLLYAHFISDARGEVVSRYLTVGKADKALDIAKNTPIDPYRSRAIAKVALHHAKSGQLDKAEEIAASIKETSEKLIAQSAISTEYVSKGNKKKGDELFAVVLTEIDKIDDDVDKGYAFEIITKDLIEREQFEKALKMANTIDVKSDKIPFLENISSGYSGKGSGDKAVEVAESIEDIPAKIFILASIASDYINSGNKKKSLKVLSRIQELSDGIPEDLSRAECYTDIGIKYHECGKKKKASRSLANAEELVKAFKIEGVSPAVEQDTYVKARAFAQLASAYYRTDSKDQADSMFKEASALAESIKDVHHND